MSEKSFSLQNSGSFRQMSFEVFARQRDKVLNKSTENSPGSGNFSFLGQPQKRERMEVFSPENTGEEGDERGENTAERRNEVLEIRMKEKEENLRQMKEEMRELRERLEEAEENQERMAGEYEEKIEDYRVTINELRDKNSILKRTNQELQDQQSKSQNKKSRANSFHKLDTESSSKRGSFEGRDEEYEKCRKELEKTRMILENVYRDNERLIGLVKELEAFKKENEELQVSLGFLQKDIEQRVEDFERLNAELVEEKLRFEDLLQENQSLSEDKTQIQREMSRFINENSRLMSENERIFNENERLIKENERVIKENERITKEIESYKRKEQQIQVNLLNQIQETQANSKAKVKKFEDQIDELKKENKALRNTSKTPEKRRTSFNLNDKENEPPVLNKTIPIKEILDNLMSLLEVKSTDSLISKVKEISVFHKNTHKLLNSIADLMKTIVPNLTRPSLKEMWSFLKFTIKNYQEIKEKYNEDLEVYGKIRQLLNADLKEEILYNLNTMIGEKKIFLQIVNKVKRMMNFREEMTISDINQELNKWVNNK